VLFRFYSKYLKRYVLDLLLKQIVQRLSTRSESFLTYFGNRKAYLIRILVVIIMFSAYPKYLTLDSLLTCCITRCVALLDKKKYMFKQTMRFSTWKSIFKITIQQYNNNITQYRYYYFFYIITCFESNKSKQLTSCYCVVVY